MGELTHPRWTDAGLGPVPDTPSGTYSGDIKGTVRRAELRNRDGDLMGYVWTDGHNAAGFRKSDARTATDARVYVWRVHARMHSQGKPASDVLNPDLYAPLYSLGPARSETSQEIGIRTDAVIRGARRGGSN